MALLRFILYAQVDALCSAAHVDALFSAAHVNALCSAAYVDALCSAHGFSGSATIARIIILDKLRYESVPVVCINVSIYLGLYHVPEIYLMITLTLSSNWEIPVSHSMNALLRRIRLYLELLYTKRISTQL